MITRKEMETCKIDKNINLLTLAITNHGGIPLPVTLVPSKQHDGSVHKWNGCPVLHIGNNSGWYLFTLCENGIAKWNDEPLSIWGDYLCLNFGEIVQEAVKAVGWDFSDEVLPPTIETTYYTEIKQGSCPYDKKLKFHLVIADAAGDVFEERWRRTRKEAEEHLSLVTGGGKPMIKYWRGNQKVINHFLPKAA